MDNQERPVGVPATIWGFSSAHQIRCTTLSPREIQMIAARAARGREANELSTGTRSLELRGLLERMAGTQIDHIVN